MIYIRERGREWNIDVRETLAEELAPGYTQWWASRSSRSKGLRSLHLCPTFSSRSCASCARTSVPTHPPRFPWWDRTTSLRNISLLQRPGSVPPPNKSLHRSGGKLRRSGFRLQTWARWGRGCRLAFWEMQFSWQSGATPYPPAKLCVPQCTARAGAEWCVAAQTWWLSSYALASEWC